MTKMVELNVNKIFQINCCCSHTHTHTGEGSEGGKVKY